MFVVHFRIVLENNFFSYKNDCAIKIFWKKWELKKYIKCMGLFLDILIDFCDLESQCMVFMHVMLSSNPSICGDKNYVFGPHALKTLGRSGVQICTPLTVLPYYHMESVSSWRSAERPWRSHSCQFWGESVDFSLFRVWNVWFFAPRFFIKLAVTQRAWKHATSII